MNNEWENKQRVAEVDWSREAVGEFVLVVA